MAPLLLHQVTFKLTQSRSRLLPTTPTCFIYLVYFYLRLLFYFFPFFQILCLFRVCNLGLLESGHFSCILQSIGVFRRPQLAILILGVAVFNFKRLLGLLAFIDLHEPLRLGRLLVLLLQLLRFLESW